MQEALYEETDSRTKSPRGQKTPVQITPGGQKPPADKYPPDKNPRRTNTPGGQKSPADKNPPEDKTPRRTKSLPDKGLSNNLQERIDDREAMH